MMQPATVPVPAAATAVAFIVVVIVLVGGGAGDNPNKSFLAVRMLTLTTAPANTRNVLKGLHLLSPHRRLAPGNFAILP